MADFLAGQVRVKKTSPKARHAIVELYGPLFGEGSAEVPGGNGKYMLLGSVKGPLKETLDKVYHDFLIWLGRTTSAAARIHFEVDRHLMMEHRPKLEEEMKGKEKKET